MPDASERMAILSRLERGEITPAEAERLLSGTPAAAAQPGTPPSRMGILEQLERGELSADQAAEQLAAHAAAHAAPAARPRRDWGEAEAEEEVSFVEAGASDFWRVFLGIGLVLIVLSAGLMAFILQRAGMNFWFYCTWLPLAAGIVLAALAWAARNSTWLQLQVRSRKENGQRVYINMPLPLGLIQRFVNSRSGSGRIVINEARKSGKIHLEL